MAEVVKGLPPNFEKIKEVLNPPETACFCYGGKIYNPSGNELSPDVFVHESVHTLQQGSDPEAWWNKYLSDKDFRQQQEVEAYAKQYQWVRERFSARNSEKFLMIISNHLSTLYKLPLTFNQAFTLIRKYVV